MIDSEDVPLQTIEKKDSTSLISLLQDRDEETFSQCCDENRGRLDADHGEFTYLQLACLYGLPKAVEALLMYGADPNHTVHPAQSSPIMIAAREGHYNIVEMLAQHNKVNYKSTIDGTVLHALLLGMCQARDRGDSRFVMEKCVNCIKFLMLEKRRSVFKSLDLNAQNQQGFTALHLALQLQEKNIILLLLERGAYIGSRCYQGDAAISLMNADVFEEYLNSCIYTYGKSPIDRDYQIFYNYCVLNLGRTYVDKQSLAQDNQNLGSQTESLVEMSRVPELRHLLKHPVLASFLLVKWYTLRKYFWINLTFYLTFWLFLTLQSLALHLPNDSKEEFVAWWIRYPSIVLCGSLGLLKFSTFCISPTRYVFDVENLLDIAVLTLNLLVLFGEMGAGVPAIALLLTWTKMVLLINRHPSLSSNIEMYKAACTSFLKPLMRWSMLIVAFAVSLYLLFRVAEHQIDTQKNKQTENNNCEGRNDNVSKFLEHKRMSLFKVIFMTTGEFETSSIPFDSYLGVSHVIFILFVCMITIVLFNLVNGHTVSDTQAIINDPKIVGYATLAKHITSIEDMLLCRVTTKHRTRLLPYMQLLHMVVLPNQSNRVVILGQRQGAGWIARCFRSILRYGRCSPLRMVPEVMKETKKILQERKTNREENKHTLSSLDIQQN